MRLAGKPARLIEGHARRRRADLRHRCLRTRAGLLVVLWTVAGVACNRHEDDAAQVNSPAGSELQPTSADDTRSFATIAEELFADRAAWELEYWRAKPRARDLPGFSLRPRATDADRAAAARMKAGEFRPSRLFDWQPIGVPPPWDENPVDSRTWNLWRHSLTWIEPLVATWHADRDAESLALLQTIVRDWLAHNRERPGAPRFAWNDHAAANRLSTFCWLWEIYRTTGALEASFAKTLLQAIHGHATFIAGGETYNPRSNHGMIQNGALLMAAVALPEFREAQTWRAIVDERMIAYVSENFTPEGFHLEQSPSYHWLVVRKLGGMLRFLRANDQPTIPKVDRVARKAVSVWPYLIRPNGFIVDVGDSWRGPPGNWMSRCKDWWGADVPAFAESTLPNPRADPGEFVLSFDAGYAVFTAYSIADGDPRPDTYTLFKCNAFPYTHYHIDALSFVFYGLGRDWLVDAGVHSHEKLPERQYVRSARAHNLVLIDEADFKLGPVELVDFGRTERGDFVSACHHLPQAAHTRTLTFVPPYTVEITDELVSADAEPHTYTQLFHVAPALEPRIISDRCVHVVAEDGQTCVIEQSGTAGEWKIVIGQKEPYWQGWYSSGFGRIEPTPTLCYSSFTPQTQCDFVTRISLAEAER